jgi:hypothetical protein
MTSIDPDRHEGQRLEVAKRALVNWLWSFAIFDVDAAESGQVERGRARTRRRPTQASSSRAKHASLH